MAKKRGRKKGLRGLAGSSSEHLEYAVYLLKRAKPSLAWTSCSEVPEAMFTAGQIMAHANSSGNPKLLALGAKYRDAVRAKMRACQKG